jgi:hypothetical protein
MNAKVLVAALLAGATFPAQAGERVSIRVTPAVAFAPANLLVRATVESHADNRSIVLIAESPDFYRSSEIALNGEYAPRVTQLQFRSLPSGSYEVRAVLRGVAGQELASTETSVNIVGEGGRD